MRSFLFVVQIFLLPLALFAQGINGHWSTESSVGFTKRDALTSSVVDGKIFAIGGYTGSRYLNTLEVFDTWTNSWSTPITSGPFLARSGMSASIVSGKIYMIGGVIDSMRRGQSDTFFYAKDLSVFDPSTNTWTVPSTTGTFTKRSYHTACVIDGKIYLIGGVDPHNAPMNSIQIFNTSTNSWETPLTTETFIGGSGRTSSVVHRKIYTIGGFSSRNRIDVFDPSANTWNTLNATGNTTGIFTPRYATTSCVIDDKIYVMGGYDTSYLNTFEVFDPATNIWSTPITMGKFTPRAWLSSSLVNGSIYVIGGSNEGGVMNTNEVFTPTLNTQYGKSPDIEIFPNPTDGIIAVYGMSNTILNIIVTNILGERVIELANPHESDFTLDLSKLIPGTYYGNFTTADGEITKMIVIK